MITLNEMANVLTADERFKKIYNILEETVH